MLAEKPVFVGFFPKQTYRDVSAMEIPGITEVCAVSHCISNGPQEWVEKWLHNEFGFFDTEEAAQNVVSPGSLSFEMYAFELFPFRCSSGTRESIAVNKKASVPSNFVFLGYDIVTKSFDDSSSFECSPLSCNGVGNDFPVNSHCLIANLEDAQNAYHRICQESLGEPGPYYLFAVYRKHA